MNKYWIPGPITNYGTTVTGFQGELRVVLAADYDALRERLADKEVAWQAEREINCKGLASLVSLTEENRVLRERLAEAERDAGRLREAARAVVNADCRFRNDDGDARSTAEERFDAMKKLAALAAQEKPCRYCIKERQP